MGDNLDNCRRLLEKKGANIAVRMTDDKTLLHVSSQYSNDTDTLDWVLTEGLKVGLSIEDVDKNGYTVLVFAVIGDNLDNCRWLLEEGATVAIRSNDGRTLLHFCFETSKKAETLDWVLTEGLNVGFSIEDVDKNGYTSLLSVVAAGMLDNIKWLLARGADLNATTNQQFNILHVCSKNDRSNILEYLLDLVPIEMLNERDAIFGLTPDLLSSKFKHSDCVRLLATKALKSRDEALAAETKATKDKAAARKAEKTCCSCGITFGVVIQSCACFKKRYCCTACQAADWASHKADCIMWRREIREVERTKEAEKEKEAARKFAIKPCSHCGNIDVGVMKYPCSACGQPQYCCRECQITHWKSGHKEDCKEWRRREGEGRGGVND